MYNWWVSHCLLRFGCQATSKGADAYPTEVADLANEGIIDKCTCLFKGLRYSTTSGLAVTVSITGVGQFRVYRVRRSENLSCAEGCRMREYIPADLPNGNRIAIVIYVIRSLCFQGSVSLASLHTILYSDHGLLFDVVAKMWESAIT